jgi:protein-tyrosine phosphatase
VFYELCNNIWAGPYPSEAAIQKLTEYGVKTLINLTRDDEKLWFGLRSYRQFLPDGVRMFRFPLWSYDIPPLEQMLQIVEILEDKSPSYLHCRQGLDRTGIVAMLTLMKRGMQLGSALDHLSEVRRQLPNPSPRKKYHFRYLANAHRQLFSEPSMLDHPMLRNNGDPLTERSVDSINELKQARSDEIERIIIRGDLAQTVHRALRAINALVSAGLQMNALDLRQLATILIDHRVGPRRLSAVAHLGTKLSYKLTKNYREVSYTKPDERHNDENGESVLELKE